MLSNVQCNKSNKSTISQQVSDRNYNNVILGIDYKVYEKF